MYGTLDRTITADLTDARAQIEILSDVAPGEALTWADVRQVVDALDVPSTAVVRVQNVASEDETPNDVVLNESNAIARTVFPQGTRIRCTSNGETIFVGAARKRRETRWGVDFTFYDDKILLQRMPVMGTLHYDDGEIRYDPSQSMVMNPGGYGNCELHSISTCDTLIPFFSKRAYKHAGRGFSDGELCFWTPEYWLRHLWFRLYKWHLEYHAGGLGSWGVYYDLPYMDESIFTWPETSTVLSREDLTKVLEETKCQGYADQQLRQLCQRCGDYAYGLTYVPEDGTYKSCPKLYALSGVRAGSEPDAPERELELPLQRAGSASDAETAYDFIVEEDATKTATRVEVEGHPIEIEAEFKYEEAADDTLEPAWTLADETAFKAVISGSSGFAWLDGVTYNGENGTTKVRAKTPAAIELARTKYPKVFRCYRLKSGTALETILKGVDGGLSSWFDHCVSGARPIEKDKQCQRMIIDGEESDIEYDVRVQVSSLAADPTNDWHTVNRNAGLRCTADNLIWLDNITDEKGGVDNVYAGSLLISPSNCNARGVKINSVVRLDARLRAVAEDDPNNIWPELDPTLKGTVYERNDAYRLQHQVGSNPSGLTTLDGLPQPLTQIYRDDSDDAMAHAARLLAMHSRIARAHKWRVIGIRSGYRAGTYLSQVVFVGSADVSGTREIGTCTRRTTWNFGRPQYTDLELNGY